MPTTTNINKLREAFAGADELRRQYVEEEAKRGEQLSEFFWRAVDDFVLVAAQITKLSAELRGIYCSIEKLICASEQRPPNARDPGSPYWDSFHAVRAALADAEHRVEDQRLPCLETVQELLDQGLRHSGIMKTLNLNHEQLGQEMQKPNSVMGNPKKSGWTHPTAIERAREEKATPKAWPSAAVLSIAANKIRAERHAKEAKFEAIDRPTRTAVLDPELAVQDRASKIRADERRKHYEKIHND